MNGTLRVAGQVDAYDFSLTAGFAYQFDLLGQGTGAGTLLGGSLVLTAPNGTRPQSAVESTGGNAQITYTASASGTYYLDVAASGTNTGSYTLTAAPPDDYASTIDTTGKLAIGGSKTGTLQPISDDDKFAVTLTAGFAYQFDLLGQGTGAGTLLGGSLVLTNPNGSRVLSTVESTSGDAQITYTASASGTYYLDVAASGTNTGSYPLTAASGNVKPSPDPLFDTDFYLAHNPDVAASRVDPYQHYLTTGWKEGRNPDAYFNTNYYLAQNPDVVAARVNPLLHFEASGWKEGRNPSASFSLSDYLAANPDVAAARLDPLAHYLTSGQAEGRVAYAVGPVPEPGFDAAYYYAHNPDVKASGQDAYAHYLSNGWKEGRAPDAFFDAKYYLAQNPDVAAAHIDPLAHFLASGWKESRDPSLLFSDAKYLAANPDVAAVGVDPLLHYLAHGQAEGRMAFLSGGTATPDPLVQAAFYDLQLGATLLPTGTAAAQQAAASYNATGWQRGLNPGALFDTAYYLSHNPDVAAAHVNPLLHYEISGWNQGRDPSAAFSTAKYLAAYADVRAAGIDPLLHYVVNGQAEGRNAFAV